jgi:hypothetical protein
MDIYHHVAYSGVSLQSLKVTLKWMYKDAVHQETLSMDIPVSSSQGSCTVENDHIYIKLPFLRNGDMSGVERSESLVDMDELDMGRRVGEGALELACKHCLTSLLNEGAVKWARALPSEHWG